MERDTWGSRSGFVLAAAGSAVGLGNIWAFPTQVGQRGGAAFVLAYLVCVLLVCLPLMLAEIAMGRGSGRSPVGAFTALSTSRGWWWAGWLAVLAPVGILSFYVVIAGWTIGYIWLSATGAVAGRPDEVAAYFIEFRGRSGLNAALTLAVLLVAAGAVGSGVRAGIERFTRRLMPVLLLLLVGLAVRSLTLSGAGRGVAYYLAPDPAALLDPAVIGAALGQAFFSLSLGMGIMITYGSYLDRGESIVRAAGWVLGLDTAIAMLAGLVIFPAGFSIDGFDPAATGPGLVFSVLPHVFAGLPQGAWFGAAFFLLLSLAAVTSAFSLMEVPVSHLVDEWGWGRPGATATVTAVVFGLALPSVLWSGAATAGASGVTRVDFLALMVTVWNNLALPAGGLLVALFVGYAWTVDRAFDELRSGHPALRGARLWGALIRYVCPAATMLVILTTLRAVLQTLP